MRHYCCGHNKQPWSSSNILQRYTDGHVLNDIVFDGLTVSVYNTHSFSTSVIKLNGDNLRFFAKQYDADVQDYPALAKLIIENANRVIFLLKYSGSSLCSVFSRNHSSVENTKTENSVNVSHEKNISVNHKTISLEKKRFALAKSLLLNCDI